MLTNQVVFLKNNLKIGKNKDGKMILVEFSEGVMKLIGDSFVPAEFDYFGGLETSYGKTGDWTRRSSFVLLPPNLKDKEGIINGKIVIKTHTVVLMGNNTASTTCGITVNDGNAFIVSPEFNTKKVLDDKGKVIDIEYVYTKFSFGRKFKLAAIKIGFDDLDKFTKTGIKAKGLTKNDTFIIIEDLKSGVNFDAHPTLEGLYTSYGYEDDISMYMLGNREDYLKFNYHMANLVSNSYGCKDPTMYGMARGYKELTLDVINNIIETGKVDTKFTGFKHVVDFTNIIENKDLLEYYQRITNRNAAKPTKEVVDWINSIDCIKYRNIVLPVFKKPGSSVNFTFTLVFNALVHMVKNDFNISKCLNHLYAVKTEMLKQFTFSRFVDTEEVGKAMEIMAVPIKKEEVVIMHTSQKSKFQLVVKDGVEYVFLQRFPVIDKPGIYVKIEFKDNWDKKVIGIGRRTIELIDGDYDTDTLYIAFNAKINEHVFDALKFELEPVVEKVKDLREMKREAGLIALSLGKILPGILTATTAKFLEKLYITKLQGPNDWVKRELKENDTDLDKISIEFAIKAGLILQNAIDAKKMTKDIGALCYKDGKFLGYENMLKSFFIMKTEEIKELSRVYEKYTNANKFNTEEWDDVEAIKEI